MFLRELSEGVVGLKFLRPGELKGSYTDSQLRQLGFRQARNGSWFIAQHKWEQLVRTRQIESLEEGWKDWVMGAGIAAAGVGGMSAAYDYMNKQDQPAPHQAVSVGKVQPAPVGKVQPAPQPSLMQRATKPLEKSLIKAAEAAGLKGTELQQFMAQCAHESMNFDSLEELGNDKYFARKYDKKYNPTKAKRLGNVNVGDGVRYKGRGYIQLTGRYNYAKAGEALGLPLEQKPELAAHPDVAAKVAIWFWNNRVATKVDNFADTRAATKPINPGLKHLDKRIEKFKHYSGQPTAPVAANQLQKLAKKD